MRRSFIILAILAALACRDDSPTSPATIPGPLAGAWSGTISYGDLCSVEDGCIGKACSPQEAVTARLTHDGNSVGIILLTTCYGWIDFQGRLSENQLDGRLTVSRHCNFSNMSGPSTGTATASAIHLATGGVGSADCNSRSIAIELSR